LAWKVNVNNEYRNTLKRRACFHVKILANTDGLRKKEDRTAGSNALPSKDKRQTEPPYDSRFTQKIGQ